MREVVKSSLKSHPFTFVYFFPYVQNQIVSHRLASIKGQDLRPQKMPKILGKFLMDFAQFPLRESREKFPQIFFSLRSLRPVFRDGREVGFGEIQCLMGLYVIVDRRSKCHID